MRIDRRTTAVVAIDMHRGHLDPAVATMPLGAEQCRRVIKAAQDLFGSLRPRQIPPTPFAKGARGDFVVDDRCTGGLPWPGASGTTTHPSWTESR